MTTGLKYQELELIINRDKNIVKKSGISVNADQELHLELHEPNEIGY